jgi:diguanylate cyclase (GGDEF)-like protein
MDSRFTDPGLLKVQNGVKQPTRWALLVDGLLALLSEHIGNTELPDAEEFRERLKSYRSQIGETDALDTKAAQACLEDCESNFRRARAHLNVRDAEIAEVIGVLRDALLQLAGQSGTFNERIFGSSDRFKGLVALEDIRELRKQIISEVRELRETVLERQQVEQQAFSRLSKRIQALDSKLQVAREQALTDSLTRVANRAVLDRTLERYTSQKATFALAMMDLDHFKQINDTYGHRAGDGVLVCAAQWIGESLRATDLLARFGGDEFAAVLPNINLGQAQRKFDALIKEIAARTYAFIDRKEKEVIKFTVSCGIAEFTAGDTAADVFQRADEALYDAKTRRNRVCIKRKSLLGSLFQKKSPED